MKVQNIVKIISALIGIIAATFLLSIIRTGDETIKMEASIGDYSSVTALVELARIVLFLTVGVTLVFTLRGLFSDSKKLKKALISIGLFFVIIIISFVLSEGVETPTKDGEVLSAVASRWVGAGIRTFYILSFIAIALMIFSGVSKLIKK